MVSSMNIDSIVFTYDNPPPKIFLDEAKTADNVLATFVSEEELLRKYVFLGRSTSKKHTKNIQYKYIFPINMHKFMYNKYTVE